LLLVTERLTVSQLTTTVLEVAWMFGGARVLPKLETYATKF
jgi:hypothetical protein